MRRLPFIAGQTQETRGHDKTLITLHVSVVMKHDEGLYLSGQGGDS